MFLRNVGWFLTNYMALYSKRWYSSTIYLFDRAGVGWLCDSSHVFPIWFGPWFVLYTSCIQPGVREDILGGTWNLKIENIISWWTLNNQEKIWVSHRRTGCKDIRFGSVISLSPPPPRDSYLGG
jgi:hypothetical protein